MRRPALLLAPDTRERHRIAARLCGGARSVLDVGGVHGALTRFLPGVEVVTANLAGPADVHYDGGTLPFADGSFDAVTSLDVLEHLDPARRQSQVAELLRVARGSVVCCTPLGTPEHAAAERELAERLRSLTGGVPPFLQEHIAYGLPTEDELRALPAGHFQSFELWFHGDVRRAVARAERGARARRGSLLALLALVADSTDVELHGTPYPPANRAFLRWSRPAAALLNPEPTN